jgi:type II secretory pathway pseudopilin PulG
MSCLEANDAIQAAIDAYYSQHGEWPTAGGLEGDIEWSKLVPNHMDGIPGIDSKCDWWVNNEPVGEVCIKHVC